MSADGLSLIQAADFATMRDSMGVQASDTSLTNIAANWTVDVSGNVSGMGTIEPTPTTHPQAVLYDSNAPGATTEEKAMAYLWGEYVDGADDAENSSAGIAAMAAGAWFDWIWYDSSVDQVKVTRDLDVDGFILAHSSMGVEERINFYDSEELVAQITGKNDGVGVSRLTFSVLMGSTMTDFFTPCGNCGLTHFWKPIALPASTTSLASLNIPSGTAPSSPAEGDMYYDGTHLYFKPSGDAVDLLQTASDDMVYPGEGVPVSTGSAWGTSLTVGTGASNLVQLDESGKLPAVDGSSLTGLFDPAAPGAIGGTTPAAATFTTLSAGATGFSVDADGDVTAKSLSITRVTGQASYSEYFEVPANGDNKVTVKSADNLAADYTVTLPSATGTLQLAGAEVDLPSSDADPDTTGEIRHDSTITGLLRGALKWFDGTGARILVDLDTAPSDDDYVVSYDADADKFYMKADATGTGGDQLVDIVTTAPLLVNGGANVDDALPGSDADITFSVQDASTSQKGVAQFSSDNFAALNGTITVKDDGIAAAEIADLYGFELLPIAWTTGGVTAPGALDSASRGPWEYRAFASDADEDVNFIWQIPSDADVGASVNNFWFRVHYLIVNATGPSATEGVAFSLAGVCINDNGATNAAKGSAVTVTDDELNASQWDYMRTDWSSAVAITTASAGSICELNLERTTGDAVDDYGQDVGVAFIEIRYVKNPTR